MVAPFSDIYLNRGKGVAIPNDFINAKKLATQSLMIMVA